MRTQLFFYWFQGWNLQGEDQNFKRDKDVKIEGVGGGGCGGEIKYQGGDWFFLFYQSKLLSQLVPVSPDTTLEERFLG